MSDSFTVTAGVVLMVVGAIAWLLYMRRPQAMLLDAISMGWVGFIVWIGLSMFLLGLFEPQRKYRAGREEAVLLIVMGLLGYLAGLGLTPVHRVVSRVIPTPRDTLTIPSIWFIMIMGFAVAVAASAYAVTHPYMGITDRRIVAAFVSTGLGAAGVLAMLLMTAFRGAYGSKLLGLVILLTVAVMMYVTYWSRRPLPGLLGGMIALYYHFHLRQKSLGARALFLGGSAVAMVLLLLLLTSTRGARFRETRVQELFGRRTQRSMFGGMTINVHVLEFTVLKYPEQFPYLNGTGVLGGLILWPIPRTVWPGKPMQSGGVISYQWTHGHKWSVANTLIGESFMNFGWAGTPLFMCLIGAIVGGTNRKLHSQQHNLTAWVAWFAILPDFASEWRGSLAAMTVQPFCRVALFLLMAWLLGKLFPAARRLSTRDVQFGMGEDEPHPAQPAPGTGGRPAGASAAPPDPALATQV